MDDLREELEELEIENFEKKSFIPYDALKDLLTESRVAGLIRSLSENGDIQVWQQPELIGIVLKNGLRVFATLLSLARPELILKFKETDHFAHSPLDSKLPLSKDSLRVILENEKLMERFYKHQWKFLAPYFRADQSHRQLQDNVILPFITCEPLAEGGFGEVHRMTIPASYHELVTRGTSQVTIIRKQIKPRKNAEKDFQKEEHILSFLRCLEHPNIIQLLTAYTISRTHYLLFPLADGNLKQFLHQEHRLPGFQTDNEVFQALYELASAIEAVHEYFSDTFSVQKIGCHYDLKPDNILYRSGKLILSDFGLSRLSDKDDGSRSLYRNGGGEYWAPECVSVHEDLKNLRVGRSSDMWSFGCILCEVLTYLQEGSDGVQIFSERRMVPLTDYYECKLFHEGTKPSEAVTQWLSRLSNRPTITDAQTSLMVVIENLLQQDPDARSKAQSITSSLFLIAQAEVYHRVEMQIHPLLDSAEAHLEILVEYERFRIWGETNGFGESERVLEMDNLHEAKSFGDMQMIRESLFKLCQEVGKISTVLETGGSKPYKVCYHLQKVIDKLWDMQPSLIRESMMNTLENRILSTDDRARLESIESAFQESDANSLSYSSTAYRRIGLLAAMKQIASALESRKESPGNMLLDEKRIAKSLKDFHWHKTTTFRTAEGSEMQILIERLEYDGAWAERIDELIRRVQDIASFRAPLSTREAFPVLTSAGYYHDLAHQAFGIVYFFPPRQSESSLSIAEIEEPISLQDIVSTIRSRTERPPLDRVFSTALKLLNVVLTLHKASWLHKNISSYNIIFFPDRFRSIAEAMNSPYFIGFSYSRLNLKTAFTQGPSQQLEYHHPDYLDGTKRFCQEYDYYSVGLVLLELGFWLPLEKITKHLRGTPREMLKALLQKEVPKLKTYMGTAYEDAVSACLTGDFGGSSDPIEVREAFERKVLLKIEHQVRQC